MSSVERTDRWKERNAGAAIGVDLGGTKCAAGIVSLDDGQLLAERRCPTLPDRGGAAVLNEVGGLIQELLVVARQQAIPVSRVGIGIAELVDPVGTIVSDATFDWQHQVPDAATQLSFATGLPVLFEADVRAAARAEARWGHGQNRQQFLFVSVGTGISASWVLRGEPFKGARGLTGTFASAQTLVPDLRGVLHQGPPLEAYSSGSAIVQRYRQQSAATTAATDVQRAEEVVRLATHDHEAAREIVTSAAMALGAAIAQLVNMLDPEVVVLGGGLGVTEGLFRSHLEQSLRGHIWSDLHRDLPLLGSALGAHAGILGAALASTIETGADTGSNGR